MGNLITRRFQEILEESEIRFEEEFSLEVNHSFLDDRIKGWLAEDYLDLGGTGDFPLLNKIKLDFKIDNLVIKYDDESNFNRYRLTTFRSDIYDQFEFDFIQSYRRLCRTYERDCLKVAMNKRSWYGPPIAKTCFGEGNEPGDFYGDGAPGWKLHAFNALQLDLQTRLHGLKLVRISPYETLMIGGKLQRIDHLLMKNDEETRAMISRWFLRKIGQSGE